MSQRKDVILQWWQLICELVNTHINDVGVDVQLGYCCRNINRKKHMEEFIYVYQLQETELIQERVTYSSKIQRWCLLSSRLSTRRYVHHFTCCRVFARYTATTRSCITHQRYRRCVGGSTRRMGYTARIGSCLSYKYTHTDLTWHLAVHSTY